LQAGLLLAPPLKPKFSTKKPSQPGPQNISEIGIGTILTIGDSFRAGPELRTLLNHTLDSSETGKKKRVAITPFLGRFSFCFFVCLPGFVSWWRLCGLCLADRLNWHVAAVLYQRQGMSQTLAKL
jgi:hypothetical protein